jgi:hypothetical protein
MHADRYPILFNNQELSPTTRNSVVLTAGRCQVVIINGQGRDHKMPGRLRAMRPPLTMRRAFRRAKIMPEQYFASAVVRSRTPLR